MPHLQSRRPRPAGPQRRGARSSTRWSRELAATRWNTRGNCLLVVGATYPRELAEVRALVGDMPLLVPGVGAQGGDVAAGGAARPDRRRHRPHHQLLARHPVRLGAARTSPAPRAPRTQALRDHDQPSRHRADERHARAHSPRLRSLACLRSPARALPRQRVTLGSRCRRAPAILLRGGGPDPDSLDPQKARGFEAQSDPARPVRGTDHARQARGGGARASRRSWSVSADGQHLHASSCAPRRAGRTATRSSAADFVAALRRLVDPATASRLRAVRRRHRQRLRHRRRPQAARIPRRVAPPTRRPSSSASPRPPPTCRRCCRTRAPARCTAPTLAAHPDGSRSPGVMVSNGAFVLKEWVQGSHVLARRNRYYWNDAATRLDAVKYLLIPDENAELARYRSGELQVTFVVPRGQFDWIRAHLGAELHIAPQLTTYYYGFNLRRAPFKDDREAAPRAVAGHRPREARARSCCASASCPPTAGCRPGVDNYAVAVLRLPGRAHGRSASPRRSGCTREAGYSTAAPAALRAALQRRRGAHQARASPSPRCGRRRSAPRCA